MMTLSNPFYPYLKPLWMPNCAPFAVSARVTQVLPGPPPYQVCLRLTWPMTYLKKARAPLHVSDLLARIKTSFSVAVDRESLVSSLSKKVARGDRFLRTAKNTFGLRPEAQ